MKATKLASGFAVTALAAAVSMSAMASTDVKVNGDDNEDSNANFEASVNFTSTYKFEDLNSYQGTSSVTNERENSKSNSGKMTFALKDDKFKVNFTVDGSGLSVSDAIYDNGTISFGDTLGSIVATEGGVEGVVEKAVGVNGAFRYTDKTKAFGMKGLQAVAQLETNDDAAEIFGATALAQYKAPGSQTQISVNAQYNDTAGTPNTAQDTLFGAKVDSQVNRSFSYFASFNVRDVNEIAAKGSYTNNDGLAGYLSVGVDDENATVEANASYELEITEDISWTTFAATVTVPTYTGANEKVQLSVRQDQGFVYAEAKAVIELETNTQIRVDVGSKSTSGYAYHAFVESNTPDGGDADTFFGADGTYSMDNGVETGASVRTKAGETSAIADGETEAVKAMELIVWASYEIEGGAILKAQYQYDTDNTDATDYEDADGEWHDDSFNNKLVLTADYSF